LHIQDACDVQAAVTDVDSCGHETSEEYERLKSLKLMPLGFLFGMQD
jgi:hypothetical protein